jgi:adenylate cyclase
MPSVRILNGPNRDQVHTLRGGELVGRDPSNEIQVFAPGVSRKHFQFKMDPSGFLVMDLGSSNGTYVNNQRITRHILNESDTITVGGINLLYSASDNGGIPPGLSASSEEVQLGAFGHSPAPMGGGGGGGFGANPMPALGVTQPAVNPSSVVLKEDEDDAGEDYSLDASIIFSPGVGLPTEDKIEGLQKRLQIMFEISQALGEVQNLDDMLDKIMDELFAVFPQADRGFILLGSDVDKLVPMVVRNRQQADGEKPEVQISKTIARKILGEKQAILSQNAMEDDRFSGGMSIINFRILSMACAPIVYREDVFGLIQVDTQDRAKKFTPDDLNLLAGIAVQAATFIKNLKLFEAAQKEAQARSNLERYFTPALASQVASGAIQLNLGGDTREGTVFFSDIIGFTSMSENMTPSEVVNKINRYMRYMVDIVFKYNGSVDKFIGDCIMAVWGVPLPMEEEAVAAVCAGVEMQNALFLLNGEFIAEGSTAIYMGIGLNSGPFVAGNMGSERRMEYTVIGDNVNLAQRVESKAGRGMVLVSDTTYASAGKSLVACKLKPVSLKGKAQPVETYSVRGVEQESTSGRVFMLSIPCAVGSWSPGPECSRGLLVKVKLAPGKTDQALGLIVFHGNPPVERLRLEFYAPEMPRYFVEFDAQGEVGIQAKNGCCLKGVLHIAGTPLEALLVNGVHESTVSPDDIPRAKTPE